MHSCLTFQQPRAAYDIAAIFGMHSMWLANNENLDGILISRCMALTDLLWLILLHTDQFVYKSAMACS